MSPATAKVRERALRLALVGTRQLSDRLSDLTRVAGRPPLLLGSAYSALDQWLATCRRHRQPARDVRIGVLMLRNRFWAEWATYCCCRLYLMGYDPVLLYSGDEVRRRFRQRPLIDPDTRGFFAKVRRQPVFAVVDLDAYVEHGEPPTEAERAELRLAAQMSVAYDAGKEFAFDEEKIARATERIVRLQRAAVAIARTCRLDRAALPSGIIGLTAGMLRGFQQAGLPLVTVEDWGLQPRHMVYNIDRPVFAFDYAAWFRALPALTPAQQALVDSYVSFQDDPAGARTEAWSDYRAYQPAAAHDPLPPELEAFLDQGRPTALLGTNVIGDSATLGRERCFESQLAWLEATLAWFAERPDRGLVIRIHPGEAMGPCPMPLAPWVEPRVAGLPNVHVVGPTTAVNTYAIARRARAGLLYVSNLGADLIARGLPAIAVGKAPYDGLGIAWEPATPEAYLALLDSALRGDLAVSPEASERASRLIYVFTRLMTVPGNPRRNTFAYDPLDPALDDPLDELYRIIAGEQDREGHVAWDARRLDD
ncbi:MAG: hypothetical protein H6746_05610 [Deltaproteobacteria bacterium]|nr:hypothetical protein [Deltaproteobacteria bacterium]